MRVSPPFLSSSRDSDSPAIGMDMDVEGGLEISIAKDQNLVYGERLVVWSVTSLRQVPVMFLFEGKNNKNHQ